jgi:flavin-binding protein dodecin
MNELHASAATMLDTAPDDDAASRADVVTTVPLEFVGSSDETIAEAVRRALFDASTSLTTLDGMGVVVIPQIDHQGPGPRFHVILRVSPQTSATETARS